MSKTIEPTTADDVTKQLEALRSDVSVLSKTLSDLATERAVQMKDSARDSIASHSQAMADGAAQLTRQAEDTVRAQPLAATAVAAGLGFVVGYLCNRR